MSPQTRFHRKAFELLEELAENNTREWYHEHKNQIKAELLEPFAETLVKTSTNLKRNKLALSGNSKTMFRLNRDTRFSNRRFAHTRRHQE